MTMSANRRDFLKSSAALAAGAALTSAVNHAFAGGSDVIKVGVVGCGGRGSGAAEDCLKGSKETKIVALGDVYRDHATGLRKRLANFGDRVDVPDDRCFGGLNAYQQVLDAG